MNNTPNPPKCPYCRLPVGDNEFDIESGGYFSAHFACYSASADGRYLAADGQRYASVRAAAERTQAYADANHRMSFVAFDTASGAIVHRGTMAADERVRRFASYDHVHMCPERRLPALVLISGSDPTLATCGRCAS